DVSAAQAVPPDGLTPATSELLAVAIRSGGSTIGDFADHVLATPVEQQRRVLLRLQRDRGAVAAEVARRVLASHDPTLHAMGLATLRIAPAETADLAIFRRYAQVADSIDIRLIAIGALGDLGDLRSGSYLIDLLSESDARLVDAARGALEKLSGLRYGDNIAAWRKWLGKAEQSANELLPVLAKQLGQSEPAVVKAAISKLGSMPAQKAEAVELLTPVVQHDDAEIGALAGATLKKLGAPVPARTAIAADVSAAPRSIVTGAASLIVGRPLSDQLATLIAGALLLGLVGGIALMIFLMRTREVAAKVAKGMTRRLVKGAKGATQAIRKKITFTS
ncbi:MAG: hypothetical protein H0X45_11610, partial [Planctomycetes bacterium]|nr:hypothetical protein [Planctomycetota bacterium]